MLTRLTIVIWLLASSILHAQDKGFKFKGSAAVGGFHFYQNQSQRSSSIQPYGASLAINARLGYGTFDIPIAVSFNNQGTEFNNPFNRFGISPTYKWAKAHLGWRSMRFSKFAMQNTQFFGAGIELNPGLLRLSAMKGKIDYRIPGLPAHLQNNIPRRNATAVKLGIGNQQRYFDISLLKVKDAQDNEDSIIRPKENAVLGIQAHLPIWNKHILLELDGGVSALTENRNASDKILNEADIPEIVNDIITPNISTHVNYALEGKLTLQNSWFSLANTYRRVMPEYRSLGLNYLRNDQEAFLISPSLRLWKNKLLISTSVGIERNNLDNLRNMTQDRLITSANINVRPNQSNNLNLHYSNYSFDQQIVYDSLLTESLIIQQVNSNYGGTYTYSNIGSSKVQVITLNAQMQRAQNLNNEALDNNTLSLITSYSHSGVQSPWSFNLGFNYFDIQLASASSKQLGFNSGISYRNKKTSIRAQLGAVNSISGNKTHSYYSRLSWRRNLRESLSIELSSKLRWVQRELREDINTVRTDLRLLQKW